MNRKLLAFTSLFSALTFAAAMPALALEVGTTNTVTQTITSGRLQINETDNHWDCGYQNTFQVSGDGTLQAGLGGQVGGQISENRNSLSGGIFGDGDGYIGLTGSGTVSYTHQDFSDHNVTKQYFNGTQTTSSSTIQSATFVNF